jgi:hypothetical protein
MTPSLLLLFLSSPIPNPFIFLSSTQKSKPFFIEKSETNAEGNNEKEMGISV